jgi:hypothetical protein
MLLQFAENCSRIFLEMLLCAAFQCLAAKELERYFRHGLQISANVGLNVMSPLLQGMNFKDTACFRELLCDSPDPEIQSWPTERHHQSPGKPKPIPKPAVRKPTVEELIKGFAIAFRKMAHDASPISDQDCVGAFLLEFPETSGPAKSEWEQELEKFFASSPSRIPPLGDVQSAKVGFLVNRLSISDRSSSTLPPQLLEVGFHPGNAMLWTETFEDPFIAPEPAPHVCNMFTTKLIRNSKLKIILLCGFTPQSEIVEDLSLGKPETIQLRGYDIEVWIKSTIIEGQHFHRAFIATPALHKLRGVYWKALQQFGEIFRLVKLLTNVNLQCYLPERAGVYARIFHQTQLERDFPEMPHWKVDTLDPLIKHWLFCKGFEEDGDLVNLEKLSGSLATGLCMLTHILPRNPHRSESRPNAGAQDPSRKMARFDAKIFATVKELYERLQRKTSLASTDTADDGRDDPSELPLPGIIIKDRSSIIIDAKRQTVQLTLEDDTSNIKDDDAFLMQHPFQLALSHIEELSDQSSVQHPWTGPLRTSLLSEAGRRFQVYDEGRQTSWIKVRGLYVGLPENLVSEKFLTLRAHLAPQNEIHPSAWIKHSELLEPDDPAHRLAISYRLDSDEPGAEDAPNWLHFPGKELAKRSESRDRTLRRIFKANGVVDFLCGDSHAEIACRSRRYVLGQGGRDCWYTSSTQ